MQLIPIDDRWHRPRRGPVVLYHGGCCCCCCLLAPLGNVLAALSVHRDGGRVGLLGHIGLHIGSLILAVLAGMMVAMIGGRSGAMLGLVVGGLAFMSLLFAASGVWLPASTSSSRRMFLVIAESVAAVVLMIGFSAASLWCMRFF